MSIERGDALHAAASVQTIAAFSSFLLQSGDFQSVVRQDIGDYMLTLGPGRGVDQLQCVIVLCARGNLTSAFRIQHVSDEQKRVICDNCNADVDFDVLIVKP